MRRVDNGAAAAGGEEGPRRPVTRPSSRSRDNYPFDQSIDVFLDFNQTAERSSSHLSGTSNERLLKRPISTHSLSCLSDPHTEVDKWIGGGGGTGGMRTPPPPHVIVPPTSSPEAIALLNTYQRYTYYLKEYKGKASERLQRLFAIDKDLYEECGRLLMEERVLDYLETRSEPVNQEDYWPGMPMMIDDSREEIYSEAGFSVTDIDAGRSVREETKRCTIRMKNELERVEETIECLSARLSPEDVKRLQNHCAMLSADLTQLLMVNSVANPNYSLEAKLVAGRHSESNYNLLGEQVERSPLRPRRDSVASSTIHSVHHVSVYDDLKQILSPLRIENNWKGKGKRYEMALEKEEETW